MHKNKLIIGLVVLLTISTFAFIGCKIGNKVYNTVAPLPMASSPTPTPKIKLVVNKEIRGNRYSIASLDDEGLLFLFKDLDWYSDTNIQAESKKVLNQILPLSSGVTDFWFDDKTETLYVLLSNGTELSEGIQEILTITPKGSTWQVKSLYTWIGWVYSSTKFVDLLPNGTPLLMTEFGDGGGYEGNLWKVTGNVKTTLYEFTSSAGEGGSYPIGYANGLEIFQHFSANSDGLIDKIFSFNPRTGAVSTIFPGNSIPSDASGFEINNDAIEFSSNNDKFSIDLKTYKITKI